MTSGRRAHNADLCRVDIEFGGVLTSVAQGCLSIFERYEFMPEIGQAILYDNCCDALVAQPLCDVKALLRDADATITATRKNDNTAMSIFLFVRLEDEKVCP